MKKKIYFVCLIIIYFFMLVLSYSDFEFPTISVYATKADSSSTNSQNPKDQSSTDKNKPGANDSSSVVNLLARVINAEARGEPYLGQVAVGAVIMNRVKSAEFPNTVAGVIYQKGQFTSVKDGQFDKPIAEGSTVKKAAQEAYNGSDPTNGALFFYNAKTTSSKWLYTRPTLKVIGSHTFAK